MASRDVLANIIGPDGQFPMTPVDQDSKLNRLRTTMMKYCFNCGTDCSACIDNIIHQDYLLSRNITRNRGASGFRKIVQLCEIITIE